METKAQTDRSYQGKVKAKNCRATSACLVQKYKNGLRALQYTFITILSGLSLFCYDRTTYLIHKENTQMELKTPEKDFQGLMF